MTSPFFTAGGTLWQDAPSYLTRRADAELHDRLLAGEYCNVLAARQMGKSSLMVRTASRLQARGIRTAIVDMSALGSGSSPDEWFFGFLDELAAQLGLALDLPGWWRARADNSPVQRFSQFLRDALLQEITAPIVIFVDEIDSALTTPFADDFFAAIRAASNNRASLPAFARLTFVLIGVARPADLIRERTRTPYNIGTHIALTDFSGPELAPFEAALEAAFPTLGAQIIQWVLDWTGGQPYLTQKLCAALVELPGPALTSQTVDETVHRLFLGDEARRESNLRAIRDRLEASPHKSGMLETYGQLLRGRPVPDEERSLAINELKLTGLVGVGTGGLLHIRNRLYREVFDRQWVRRTLPVPHARRLAIAFGVLAALALALAGIALYRQQRQPALTFAEQFQTSASPEVRLTSLARLIELDERSAQDARALFDALPQPARLGLFTGLAAPQNVAAELVTVVDALYQAQPDTSPGNETLTAMKDALAALDTATAASLQSEIAFWLQGRQAAARGEYAAALGLYDSAWVASQGRGHANPGILLDRARAALALAQYPAALADLETTLQLDPAREGEVLALINASPALRLHLSQNEIDQPGILALAPRINPPPPTPKPSATPAGTRTPESPPPPTGTPPPTATPINTAALDLAFVSDRNGEFGLFLMDTSDPAAWLALPPPQGYERTWWPTFCGTAVAAETQDLDGLQPQWIHLFDPAGGEALPLETSLSAARLGVPRCSAGGQMAFSAYLPNEFEGWLLAINNLASGPEYLPQNNPSFGYVTWPQDESFFLSMTIIGPEFYVLESRDYAGAGQQETIARGKYPALSPDGRRFVYLCSGQSYLCLQDVNGATPKLLTAVTQGELNGESIPVTAMWSADGQWIYFASSEDGDWDIYRIHPDGSNLQNLTADWPTNEMMPALNWPAP